MKDKLEKTGLTRSHYRKQLALKISLFALAFITVCALPIGLSYRVAEVVNEETSSQIVENSSSSEEIAQYQEK